MSVKRGLRSPVETTHADVYPAIDPRGKLAGSCTGKLICILGASQGCGQAMAVAYAQAGAAKLFLTARAKTSLEESEKLVAAANSSTVVHRYSMDLREPDGVQKGLQAILQDADDKLDVLVANAGVLEEWKPFAESEPDEWWTTWEVNVRGVYLAARQVVRSMLASERSGTIILLSSIGALVCRPGASAYQSTKTAINRLAEFIDADHGKQGIRAFAIHPGGVLTKLARGMPESMHGVLKDTPSLSGGFCVYLSTSRADYLRGRYISAQWDVDELEAMKQQIVEQDLLKMVLAM